MNNVIIKYNHIIHISTRKWPHTNRDKDGLLLSKQRELECI